MMGSTHALTGIAPGLFLSTQWGGLTTPQRVAAFVITFASTMLPDLDKCNTRISNAWGPFSNAIARVVHNAAGGHREGTHSIFGVALLGFVMWVSLNAFQVAATPVSKALMATPVILAVSMAITALGPCLDLRGPVYDLGPVVLMGLLLAVFPEVLSVVPVAVMTGCATHIAGDCLTKQGCPLLWPFSPKRLRLSGMKTNGRFEMWVVRPVAVVGLVIEAGWLVLSPA